MLTNNNLKTSLCFLDETGVLNRPEDRFFALGIIKTDRPEILYNPLQYLRDKNRFYDEIKWKNISSKNYPMLKRALQIFADEQKARFAAVVLDKKQLDFQGHFANNFWRVYESFTVLFLRGNVAKNENLVVLADYYPSPKDNLFEQNVKIRVNQFLKRPAILAVCRLNSKTSDILQLADLLLGAVVYDFKIKHRLIAHPSKIKRKFLKDIKRKLEVNTFCQKIKNQKLNILPFTGNKKTSDHGSYDQHLRLD